MKLVFPEIETTLTTELPGIQTVVIENRALLRRWLTDLLNQMNGLSGESVLSENNKPQSIAKKVELLDRFLNFEINQKNILSKITSALEEIAVDEEHYSSTSLILTQLEVYLDNLAYELPCDLQASKMGVSSIIKAAGICVRDDYSDPLERLLDYMELVRDFLGESLFLTLNLRNFFTDEETESFMETVIAHSYHVIMIESSDYKRLSSERRVTIDSDLCEF